MHWFTTTVGFADVLVRLVAATLIGAALGLNREMRGKPAGLRTHALVALGTALALGAATALPWHRWKRVLTGAAAGTLVVALVWTLVPAALTRAFMVEHTVAAADGGQAAPVPRTTSGLMLA